MSNLSRSEHQTSINILEGELQLAARNAVRRYRAATGLTPKTIQIQIEGEDDDGPAVEVTVPAPL